MSVTVILHDIRSVHNVGSIFRTADGAGVSRIYLSGYTPTPIDRFGRVVPEMNKTALGGTESVPWEQVSNTEEVVHSLQKEGVTVIAVEQHERAIPYTHLSYEGDVAFILGNEIEGVPRAVCESADHVVHIPMHGVKESLNVSVAAGIILFHAVQNREK